jgi:protein phosphatase
MRIISSFKTYIGERKTNDDTLLIQPKLNLFGVADGMGGHEEGKKASEYVCKTVENGYNDLIPLGSLIAAIKKSHKDLKKKNLEKTGGLFDISKTTQYNGSTFTGLAIKNEKFYLVHCGDSCCYRIDSDKIQKITKDHNMILYRIEQNIPEKEAKMYSDANNLISVIGHPLVKLDARDPIGNYVLRIQTIEDDFDSNSILMLCSDGLIDLLEEDEIREYIIQNIKNREYPIEIALETASEKLIYESQIKSKKNKDNISFILLARDDLCIESKKIYFETKEIFKEQKESQMQLSNEELDSLAQTIKSEEYVEKPIEKLEKPFKKSFWNILKPSLLIGLLGTALLWGGIKFMRSEKKHYGTQVVQTEKVEEKIFAENKTSQLIKKPRIARLGTEADIWEIENWHIENGIATFSIQTKGPINNVYAWFENNPYPGMVYVGELKKRKKNKREWEFRIPESKIPSGAKLNVIVIKEEKNGNAQLASWKFDIPKFYHQGSNLPKGSFRAYLDWHGIDPNEATENDVNRFRDNVKTFAKLYKEIGLEAIKKAGIGWINNENFEDVLKTAKIMRKRFDKKKLGEDDMLTITAEYALNSDCLTSISKRLSEKYDMTITAYTMRKIARNYLGENISRKDKSAGKEFLSRYGDKIPI